MTPQRPYLLRAIYEWIVDNEETPYILVNPFSEGVSVPNSAIIDDKVVLNISPMAVKALDLGLEAVVFSCRFSGVEHSVYLPIRSILSIYSRDSGRGFEFDDSEYPVDEGGSKEDREKPKLELV